MCVCSVPRDLAYPDDLHEVMERNYQLLEYSHRNFGRGMLKVGSWPTGGIISVNLNFHPKEG